jgi:hypothetical protein
MRYFVVFFCGCMIGLALSRLGNSEGPTLKLEVKLDPQRRPLVIYSYYEGSRKPVIHGQRVTYDWTTGMAQYESFRDGAKLDDEGFSRIWNR